MNTTDKFTVFADKVEIDIRLDGIPPLRQPKSLVH
jgi:hypothetical protein